MALFEKDVQIIDFMQITKTKNTSRRSYTVGLTAFMIPMPVYYDLSLKQAVAIYLEIKKLADEVLQELEEHYTRE